MNELTYRELNGYQVPDLELTEGQETYGKYGMLRKTFLMEHRKGTYSALLTQGKLTEHLAEMDRTARAQVEQTVEAMKAESGVTEALKAGDPMEWVGRLNALLHQAEEAVLAELIYS